MPFIGRCRWWHDCARKTFAKDAIPFLTINSTKSMCTFRRKLNRTLLLRYMSVDNDSTSKRQSNVEKLLEDATVPEESTVEGDTENWTTSPYPKGLIYLSDYFFCLSLVYFCTSPGSYVPHKNQSQAQHALRPNVDPKETSILMFPGQGTQFVGMGKNLLVFPQVKDLFESASEILKYDLLKLCLEGPKSKLDQTIYSQPAIFVCSLGAVEKLKEERPSAIENCMAVAGYSIGELTALTFGGCFTFEQGGSEVT